MKIKLEFDTEDGTTILLNAETLTDKCMLHFLWENKDNVKVYCDNDFHESYKLRSSIMLRIPLKGIIK